MQNLTCTLCEAATSLISSEANMTNATVQTISHAVMALCGLIAGRLVAKECDFIIDNIDDIVSWLAAGMNRRQICEKLGLCKVEEF